MQKEYGIDQKEKNASNYGDKEGGGDKKKGNSSTGSKNNNEMKPASSYDYKKDVIPGKFDDDMDYITGGAWYETGYRATQIFWRDLTASDNSETVQASVGLIFIRGFGKINKNLFHPSGGGGIKDNILNTVGRTSFSKRVGGNPDIEVVNGLIRLNGTGPFKGKSFPTNLKASDFFPK